MAKNRILQVNIDNNGGNGAFALIQYLYTYFSDIYIFDYYTMGKFVDDAVYKHIIKNGGECYSANLRKNKIIGHLLLPFFFYFFLKKHHYEIIHIHSEVAYKHYLYAIAAKIAKVRKIIIHSHSNNIDGEYKKIKYIFHKIFKKMVNKLGTDFLACSMSTANWMFEENVLNGDRFHLLTNGIIPEKYQYSESIRSEERKKLNIEKKIVLGHVGALKKVKNQEFLIEILSRLQEDYRLILIGDGEDKEKLVKKAAEKNCLNRVLFLGNRSDVNRLFQAIDVFVFPSFFEGVPMALIEAQATGVPIIASDTIHSDIKVNPNVYFCPLNSEIDNWLSKINIIKENHIKIEGYKNVYNSNYNIKSSAEKLRLIYEEKDENYEIT